jgi:High-temperature-induced dauer-formation protein
MGQSASKEKFRESVNALIEVDVSSDDADFWDELWKIPSSALEVFELLTANQVRRLRDDRFENLATLFTQAVAQLCQIVETPYNIYFDQALNCVRVLTRVLPFVLEKGALFVSLDFAATAVAALIWPFSNETTCSFCMPPTTNHHHHCR